MWRVVGVVAAQPCDPCDQACVSQTSCCADFQTVPHQQAAFKGYVNPLRYLMQTSKTVDEEGSRDILLLEMNVTHREPAEDIVQEIYMWSDNTERFLWHFHLKKERYGVGTVPCLDLPEVVRYGAENVKAFLDFLDIPLSMTFVNIGAEAGVIDDPLYSFAKSGAMGVAVEMCPDLCDQHQEHLPHIDLICDKVNPDNIVELLSQTSLLTRRGGRLVLQEKPDQTLDVLKIDIDSFDCVLVERLLKVMDPKVVLLEVQTGVPPPFRFSVQYHSDVFWRGTGWPMVGCSLSYQVHMMAQYGYDLLAFGGINSLFIKRELREKVAPAPVDEFECYSIAFVNMHGWSIKRTREWLFHSPSVFPSLQAIWEFLHSWQAANPKLPLLPFVLDV